MKWFLFVAALLVSAVVAGCGKGGSPEAVARQYLEAGSKGDLTAAKALVEARCQDKDEGKVDAIRFMGVPIAIKELTVTQTSSSGDSAVVSYSVKGSAKGSGESEVFGVKVKTEGVSVDNATKNGELKLKKVDGTWKISCG
jgi:hypothetical protein